MAQQYTNKIQLKPVHTHTHTYTLLKMTQILRLLHCTICMII
jgi:hypothetical protein